MNDAVEGGSGQVLVTGAGSFVGNYIVRHLTSLGVRVTGVYRTRTKEVELLEGRDNLTLVCGDLAVPEFLATLPACPENVIHVAASGPRPGVSGAQLLFDNALATAGLVDYALDSDCARFILLSSVSVHGQVREARISVRSEIRNPGMYGLTKRAAELLLEERSSDLPSVAVRLPAVLGRGAQTHWLARLVAAARAGREIEISNPDTPFNNVVHQTDLSRFMVTLLETDLAGFHAFPVASTDPIPIAEVVSTVLTETSSTSPVEVVDSILGAFGIDDSYARSQFGYESLPTSTAVRNYAISESEDE